MRKRWSDTEVVELTTAAKSGVPLKEIAENFGVSISSVSHKLSRIGIKFVRRPFEVLPNEIWKKTRFTDISVSSFGRVKRDSSNSLLKGSVDVGGYRVVEISLKGSSAVIAIHRLVAETFLPNPDGLKQVNHKDLDKQNNAIDNLEWCSPAENIQHMVKNCIVERGRLKYPGGKYPEELLLSVENLLISGFNKVTISRCLNIKYRTLLNICKRLKEKRSETIETTLNSGRE